jgi:hypothetical protein
MQIEVQQEKQEPTVKTITFYGDSLVDSRLPVMVFFRKTDIIICDYSELGIYVGSKQNEKPLEVPLLLALQVISLFTDIVRVQSDNKSFMEFIKQLTQ